MRGGASATLLSAFWILVAGPLYFWCSTGAEHTTCDDIDWEFDQNPARELELRWSARDGADDFPPVEVEISAVEVDAAACRSQNARVDATFEDGRLPLNGPLCANSRYEMNVTCGECNLLEAVWTPPGPPSNVVIDEEHVGDTSVLVHWDPPKGPGTIIANEITINGTTKNFGGNATTLNLTGFQPFTVYEFAVSARNKGFLGKPSAKKIFKTKPEVPHAPNGLQETAVSNSSVSLTWQEPAPSTGPILAYIVRWTSDASRGLSAGEQNTNRTEVTFEVRGLLPFTNYTFRVLAVTSAGRGNWSEDIAVQTAVGIPGAPYSLEVAECTNSSVTLSWSGPAPSTGPILKYTIEWSGDSLSGDTDATDNEQTCVVTGLLPYSNYSFRVLAITSAGKGAWSESISVHTEVGTPHAPTGLQDTRVSNASISLTWLEPAPSTGPVQTYIVGWTRDGQRPNAGEQDTNSTEVTFEVRGLLPFTNYTFRVLAVTSAGRGKWSESIAVQTSVGVPHEPSRLRPIEISNTSITWTWNEPSPPTGPVLGFILEISSGLGRKEVDTESADRLYSAKNLQPYTDYTFRVQAKTAAGRGAWSEEVTAKTRAGIPRAPTDLRSDAVTNTSVSLLWREPTPSTGPVLKYVLSWSTAKDGGEEDANGPGSASVVRGLLPFTEYTFRVLAVTEAGRGEWSENVTTTTDIGIPQAPRAVVSVSKTATTVTLVWEDPELSTGPITSYVVVDPWRKREETCFKTTCTIEDLEPYTKYTFFVEAVSAAGRGRTSSGISVQTDVGVPHAPTNPEQSFVTNTSLSVSWKEPRPSTGPVLTYILGWSNERADGEIDTKSNATSYTVTKLLPHTNYTFQVLAVTSAGRGEWSENVTVQTGVGVPGVPRNLECRQITNVSVNVQWEKPLIPNAWQLQYEISWAESAPDDSEDNSRSIRVNSTADTVSRRISDLTPYTNYSVQVAAISEAGKGPWSKAVVFQTAIGVPKPAILLDVEPRPNRSASILWTTSGPYPGPVEYTLQAWKYPGLCSDRSSNHVANVVTGSMAADDWKNGTHFDVVGGLSPFKSYYFLVFLRTAVADGVQSVPSSNVTMPPEAPEEPEEVRAECDYSSTEARISWKPPVEPNGLVLSYDVICKTQGWSRVQRIPVRDPCRGYAYVQRDLRPERPYRISVRARVAGVAAAGREAYYDGNCELPAGVPSVDNITFLEARGSGIDRLSLEWTRDTFSDSMGSIVHYALLVGIAGALGNATTGKIISETSPTWYNFSEGTSDFYQVTPPQWNPFSIDDPDPLGCELSPNSTLLRCVVGSGAPCPGNETFCNGPLKPDTLYEMKIRAFTRGGFAETPIMYARTYPLPPRSIVKAVVVSVVLSMLALGFATGGYYLKRKGYVKPVIDGIQSRIQNMSSRLNHAMPAVSGPPGERMELISTPGPVPVTRFGEHVKIMMSDSHLKFSQEFEHLKKVSPQMPCTAAEAEENRSKNRWMNIFPFDHSRVKLLPLCDDPFSDFINANYIPGNGSQREYIATQGPLPATVDDFWRMAWEQSVSTLVMLTNCVERGKRKCEQYWPQQGGSEHFGDLLVTTVSESMLDSYVIRVFLIRLGSHERQMKQLHFTRWPDFGCPERPEDLIHFVEAVRDHLPRHDPGPILVHCSAGVGRTGTFIAVDRLALKLRQVLPGNLVDVYGTVLEIRNHRTNMVQTEDQYIYIHLCVEQLIRKQLCSPEGKGYSNSGMDKDSSRC